MEIKQIVLWGHKLHTHTHSYIHYGFKRGFEHLGYKVLWLDINDNISTIDFTNSLFITEGNVDGGIPMRDDCIYILHNCNGQKYNVKHKYNLQVITSSALKQYKFNKMEEEYCYYQDDLIMMCWATDLLPDEINKNIELVKNNQFNSNQFNSKELNFVGMSIYPWDEVKKWCENNNIIYNNYGGFSNNVSPEKNMELIQQSVLAPAVQEQWQVDNGYIPCRIFKNISYGKMGMTNNNFVNELFDNKLIYDTNIHQLMDKAIQFNDKDLLINLMEIVRDKHTYINRCKAIIYLLKKFIQKS